MIEELDVFPLNLAAHKIAPAIAVGVHTWAEGYLTPVYRAVLDGYASRGFEAKHFKKEMDKLLQFLMPLARLRGFRIDEIDG